MRAIVLCVAGFAVVFTLAGGEPRAMPAFIGITLFVLLLCNMKGITTLEPPDR